MFLKEMDYNMQVTNLAYECSLKDTPRFQKRFLNLYSNVFLVFC